MQDTKHSTHPWYQLWKKSSHHAQFPWRYDFLGFMGWLNSQQFRRKKGERFIQKYIDGRYCLGITRKDAAPTFFEIASIDPSFLQNEEISLSHGDMIKQVMQMTADAVFSVDMDRKTELITIAVDALETCLRRIGLRPKEIYKAVGRPIDTPISPELQLRSEPRRSDRLKQTWNQMMSACYDSNSMLFYSVGRRGVRVCDAWKNPTEFIQWGNRVSPDKFSYLVRKSPVKDFGPDNCLLI